MAVDSCVPTPIAEPHDERRDEDVEDEGHDEHLGVENAVEKGAHAAEHCIDSGHDGDRQVWGDDCWNSRPGDETDHDSDDERDQCCERESGAAGGGGLGAAGHLGTGAAGVGCLDVRDVTRRHRGATSFASNDSLATAGPNSRSVAGRTEKPTP